MKDILKRKRKAWPSLTDLKILRFQKALTTIKLKPSQAKEEKNLQKSNQQQQEQAQDRKQKQKQHEEEPTQIQEQEHHHHHRTSASSIII